MYGVPEYFFTLRRIAGIFLSHSPETITPILHVVLLKVSKIIGISGKLLDLAGEFSIIFSNAHRVTTVRV
jgi:hypothetical protein